MSKNDIKVNKNRYKSWFRKSVIIGIKIFRKLKIVKTLLKIWLRHRRELAKKLLKINAYSWKIFNNKTV